MTQISVEKTTGRRVFLQKMIAAASVSYLSPLAHMACSGKNEPAMVLGSGNHKYEWIRNWAQLPGQMSFGNTHGCIVVDRKNRIYVNTDSENAIMRFHSDGRYLDSRGAEFAGGLHGMTIVREDGTEYLYLAHHKKRQAIKTTLEGEVLWTVGYPEKSGLYDSDEKFRPTSVVVLPDNRFWVADGYGKSFIHIYDDDKRYVRSIGGKGTEPGQLQTPHGLWLDTRQEPPVIVVADRENHRLQLFDLEGEHLDIVAGDLRRPCNMHQHGDDLVVADLAGRVTVLDKNYKLITHLGDNPDPEKRAKNGIPREEWVDGLFISPHSACWDAQGDLYVMDWLALGRVSKLQRIS
jgi:hypothetical protein